MNKQARMVTKIIIIIIIFVFFLFFVFNRDKDEIITPPEGSYARVQDVMILSEALMEDIAGSAVYGKLSERYRFEQEALLTYGEYLEILTEIGTESTPRFESRYQPEHHLLRSDWERAFEEMRRFYDNQGEIRELTVLPVGMEDQVSDIQGQTLGDNRLLTAEGLVYSFASDEFRKYNYREIKAFCKEDRLLTVSDIGTGGRDATLANVYIIAGSAGELLYFTHDFEIRIGYGETLGINGQNAGQISGQNAGQISGQNTGKISEQLADLHFEDGQLKEIAVKDQKVSGKLKSISAESVTLEGAGTFLLAEDIQVYRVYDSLQNGSLDDLALGYDFTDFVLADGKVCGVLIARKDAMEYIRVAIRTNDFVGLTHNGISLSADVDYQITYGKYDDRKVASYRAGEVLELEPDSSYLAEGSVVVTPSAHTGKIALLSLNRSQGVPQYRGTMEISQNDGGLLAVNEVLLEEYLYSVVPSEMPASYPLEALKAQAICARTYAYRYLLGSGLASIGAHVDDSVEFQVYNNIVENAATTKAVKETTGKMLYFDGKPAGTYYYSTSCGFGTTAEVWKGNSNEDFSYLLPAAIGKGAGLTPEDLMEEEHFADYIGQSHTSDYESAEPWYRWSVEISGMTAEKLEENLKTRYSSNSRLILTLVDEEYISRSVRDVGDIQEIYCEKRLPGGVMDEVIIVTSGNTFKVISENAIRFVLNDGVSKVVRQDGSEVSSPNLLPSAFMTVEMVETKGNVTGYRLTGGGYGHGVGMSQNGAKALGEDDFTCEEILGRFYEACGIEKVY